MTAALEYGDFAPHARKSLGKLAADRTSTDDREPLRKFSQPEDVFIGQVAGFFYARDGRSSGACASAKRGLFKLQALAINLDAVRTGEFRAAEEKVHPEFFTKTLRRVMGTDPGSDPAHTFHRLAEVDGNPCRTYTELFRCPDVVGGAACPDDPFEGTQPTLRQSPPSI